MRAKISGAIAAGLVGKKIFEQIWRLVDKEEAPDAKHREVDYRKLVLALVRGDDRLNEMKLLALLGETFRPAQPEEIRETFGAAGGSEGGTGSFMSCLGCFSRLR